MGSEHLETQVALTIVEWQENTDDRMVLLSSEITFLFISQIYEYIWILKQINEDIITIANTFLLQCSML